MEPVIDIQEKKNQAADKIQKLWRSYTNRKIYKYYRDIIFFKCKYPTPYFQRQPRQITQRHQPFRSPTTINSSRLPRQIQIGRRHLPSQHLLQSIQQNQRLRYQLLRSPRLLISAPIDRQRIKNQIYNLSAQQEGILKLRLVLEKR